MTDEFTKLGEDLRGIIQILSEHQVTWFVDEITIAIELTENRKKEGADRYLELCGGMGSLTDLFICPENNHSIRKADVREVNQKLSSFRSNAYTHATKIKNPNQGMDPTR